MESSPSERTSRGISSNGLIQKGGDLTLTCMLLIPQLLEEFNRRDAVDHL